MRYLKLILVIMVTYTVNDWFQSDASAYLWLYAVVTLPGTFLHECLHYFSALLLQGDPTGFSIVPGTGALGQVMVRPNWYNAAIIGLAPLLLAPLTWAVMILAVVTRGWKKTVFFIYLSACCWTACKPSSADFFLARSNPSSWPFAAIFLAVVAYGIIKVSLHFLRTQRGNFKPFGATQTGS